MNQPTEATSTAYAIAQEAITNLKVAIYQILMNAEPEGLKNVEIGKMLGIYMGHKSHVGHIPRTLLALMENEGVVEQDSNTNTWRLTNR